MARTKENASIGIIGMGDMGKMYAQRLSDAGWRINACDRLENYESLQHEFASKQGVTIFPNGHLVSRISDFILYSVEAGVIDRVVSEYGPCMFRTRLAQAKQTLGLVIIQHRASDESVRFVEEILSSFGSKHVYLTGEMHDRITADTQAVTHAAFLSMGTAWQANQQFPWEMSRWVGGIENVKINITLRIYANKWHVYAGLAILNPAAKEQIRQYSESVTDLYKLMIGGHREELKRRVKAACASVFKEGTEGQDLLLKDEVLDRFSLSNRSREASPPNSHLSLLAIVDCWSKLGIVPYDHMICSTPLFRLWLGVTEYLFRNSELLEEALDTAIDDNTFRSDDLEFTFAARAWSDCVSFGDFESYRDRFERIAQYFAPRFPEAATLGNEMMKTILEKTTNNP
ncbi:hypothetical protein N7478_008195 [Penicillium angulare]|uniref:uncharacterized protein n=1 Tax=Penicillium angulare TaxID=116970 RepID=UPI002541BB23|nr:uncharacterized protein N7478_008195 [Penicillium angulare]KAJ5273070.1 hypothetical protein N7478_008195 [Penicillium angulare]